MQTHACSYTLSYTPPVTHTHPYSGYPNVSAAGEKLSLNDLTISVSLVDLGCFERAKLELARQE